MGFTQASARLADQPDSELSSEDRGQTALLADMETRLRPILSRAAYTLSQLPFKRKDTSREKLAEREKHMSKFQKSRKGEKKKT